MQAALPMYFPPREAVHAFWTALAALLQAQPACAGLEIPRSLSWADDIHAQWRAPDLLLSQACGYPLTTLLKDKVQLVGTLAYATPGVQGIFCKSQLICRAGDLRSALSDFVGSTLAFNSALSQSGYNALRAHIATTTARRPFFARTIDTGAHYKAIEAVRTGRADIAAIDPVSWAQWQRSNPRLCAELRVFAETEPYPGLPLITSLQTPAGVLDALRVGLKSLAYEDCYSAVRAPLLINGFRVTGMEDYAICLEMQEQALKHGLDSL